MTATLQTFSPSRKMRFRCSIRCCLSLVALIALGSWWLTWPRSTFNRFTSCVERGDYQAATSMVASSGHLHVSITSSGIYQRADGFGSELIGTGMVRSSFRLESVSMLDILLSQRCYRRRDLIMGGEVVEMEPSDFQFIARWGRIHPSVVR